MTSSGHLMFPAKTEAKKNAAKSQKKSRPRLLGALTAFDSLPQSTKSPLSTFSLFQRSILLLFLLKVVFGRPPKVWLLTMIISRAPKAAIRACSQTRNFSSNRASTAISPYHPSKTPTPARDVKNDSARREQSTAAAPAPQPRAAPSPAFNQDQSRFKNVQPLQPYRPQDMDHTFIGMKGGEIFHEMMLRHKVKHVCRFSYSPMTHWARC